MYLLESQDIDQRHIYTMYFMTLDKMKQMFLRDLLTIFNEIKVYCNELLSFNEPDIELLNYIMSKLYDMNQIYCDEYYEISEINEEKQYLFYISDKLEFNIFEVFTPLEI